MGADIRQQEAIETTGTNILVSASAGAGKTRVLVERLIKRCLKDHVSLDEVLAVTFTEAAAGEMKNRVAQRLQEELASCTDPQMRTYLEDQLVLLDSAWITTIDSFCLKIIEKYYNVIGLDPAVTSNILDEGTRTALLRSAFEHAMAVYNEQHHEQLLNCLVFSSPRSENYDALFDAVCAVITHADNSPDPAQWLNSARASCTAPKTLKEINPQILHYFFLHILSELDAIRALTEKARSYCEDSDKLKGKEEQFDAVLNRLLLLRDCVEKHDYELFRSRFKDFADTAVLPPDSKNKPYTNTRTAWQNKIKAVGFSLYPKDVLLQDMADLAPIADTIITLAAETRTNFAALKLEQTGMDFADMERFAWEILTRNDNAVAGLFRAKLKEVMVDEFQDTSVLQNQIIDTLSAPGTVFRVGDVKQSIYRFRQAKPSLMRSLMHDENTRRIVLEHNYRSKENIVEFCNLLFRRLMNIEGCEDRYDEQDTVTIGNPKAQKLAEPDPVKFVLIDTERDETGEDGEEKISAKTVKAEWIASMIQQLHSEGHPFGDNAVLVRSHRDKAVLRYVFDACGIPYDIDAREGFFQSDLCRTVLSVLKIMTDPTDEVNLLTAATSPLLGVHDETLAVLKIRHGSVYKGLKAEYPDFFRDLQEMRTLCRRRGITALLDCLCEYNRFYESISDKDRANFDFLFEKAVQLERASCSLSGLISFMEAAQDERSSEAVSRSKDDDVVTVTTIHQSKGLQYPYVYLWSTGANLAADTRDSVMVDDDLYLGLNHMDLRWRTKRKTIQRIAVEHKSSVEDLEEFTRLLYVALTRAETKLFIVDTLDKSVDYENEVTLPVIARRKGMTGLISAAMKDVPDLFSRIITPPCKPEQYAPLPQERSTTLPYFTGTYDDLGGISRPSDTEIRTYLPPLSGSRRENGTAYGTHMHEVIEQLPDRIWTTEDLKDFALSERDAANLLAFSSSELYRHCLEMEIHKEYPFYVADEKEHRRIFGTMDFCAAGTDEVILIDFKTDACDAKELLKRYTAQLKEYRHALELLYPDRQVTAYIWSLHHSQEIRIPN